MTFTTLPQMAHFIQNTHCSFAGTFISDTLDILGQMNANMKANTAMVGATFKAMTDACHGEVNTYITISKLTEAGGWLYEESTTAPA